MSKQNPYRLFLSPRSPFARRVRLALRRLGLPVEERVMNVLESQPELESLNPLGLVPTLVLPDGRTLVDSSMILESLHELHGGLWPESRTDRIELRQASTLATGLIQAAVSYFQETRMHEVPSPSWARDHALAMDRTLRHLGRMNASLFVRGRTLTQAGWDLACALDYLALRAPEIFRHQAPASLRSVLDLAREDADFRATAPQA
jgi:glutathione S-transferase